MNRLSPFRIAHWTMVVLTLANLFWISGPSCCCAAAKCCSKSNKSGETSCCSPKASDSGCSCCCKNVDAAAVDAGCPHCAAKSNACEQPGFNLPRSEKSTSPCGASGSCGCGEVSSRPAAPVTRYSPTTQQDVAPPVIALIEPQWPEVLPTHSPERRNQLLLALERPVSIRFGVWRN